MNAILFHMKKINKIIKKKYSERFKISVLHKFISIKKSLFDPFGSNNAISNSPYLSSQ